MAIQIGTTISGSVMGPFQTATNYIKVRTTIRKYEKQTGVVPLNKLKKKTYKIEDGNVDLENQLGNPILILFKKYASDTADVYFDEAGKPVLTCSYQVTQKAFNKKSILFCNCISTEARAHMYYYYLALSIKHNIITDKTDQFLTQILTKVR